MSSLSPHRGASSSTMPCCDTCDTRLVTHSRAHAASGSGHASTHTPTRSCTSLTSGPVNTGCRGATASADGRMLASASKGSWGACTRSTAHHPEQEKTCFLNAENRFQMLFYLFFGWSCCGRALHLQRSRISRETTKHIHCGQKTRRTDVLQPPADVWEALPLCVRF